MPEKSLNLNQQLALLPLVIPDGIVDFLEGLLVPNILDKESVNESLEIDYMKSHGTQLRQSLDAMRDGVGAFVKLQVEPMGRKFPGFYWCRLQFEKAERGLGFLVKPGSTKISKLVVQESEFSQTLILQELQV